MSIKKIAIHVLIAAVAILTLIAVLSIWDVFTKETLGKALATIGVVAFGALIVVLAAKEVERRHDGAPMPPMQ